MEIPLEIWEVIVSHLVSELGLLPLPSSRTDEAGEVVVARRWRDIRSLRNSCGFFRVLIDVVWSKRVQANLRIVLQSIGVSLMQPLPPGQQFYWSDAQFVTLSLLNVSYTVNMETDLPYLKCLPQSEVRVLSDIKLVAPRARFDKHCHICFACVLHVPCVVVTKQADDMFCFYCVMRRFQMIVRHDHYTSNSKILSYASAYNMFRELSGLGGLTYTN